MLSTKTARSFSTSSTAKHSSNKGINLHASYVIAPPVLNKHNMVSSLCTEASTASCSYEGHLSEPWFTLIGLGLKTVEGRLNRGKFAECREGDTLCFWNEDFGTRRNIVVKVVKKVGYASFTEYLTKEGLKQCLPSPGIETIEQGCGVYYKYYSEADEEAEGVVALHIQLCKA